MDVPLSTIDTLGAVEQAIMPSLVCNAKGDKIVTYRYQQGI